MRPDVEVVSRKDWNNILFSFEQVKDGIAEVTRQKDHLFDELMEARALIVELRAKLDDRP